MLSVESSQEILIVNSLLLLILIFRCSWRPGGLKIRLPSSVLRLQFSMFFALFVVKKKSAPFSPFPSVKNQRRLASISG
jgi:hypothetical protein